MSNYPYVDMTRANADGTYPVYIIVKNDKGRFFVNAGMTTCGRLEGLSFPRADRNWRQKTTELGRILAEIERVCLQGQIVGYGNGELKTAIKRQVFGIEKKPKAKTLSDYIRQFSLSKREQTAKLYTQTANAVYDYDRKATLSSVDAAWLDGFRKKRIGDGLMINGVGMQLRNIRAVFNWARREGLTDNYPFLDYSITFEETKPNNISVTDLRMLRDYPCEEWQKRYVDFFMLSFYLAGINPVDLLKCKADAMRDCHLSFIRQKTNKQGQKVIRTITIPVVDEAMAIIRRYKSKDGYLLCFMDDRASYISFLKQADKALRKIGPSCLTEDKAGRERKIEYHPILPHITMYTARYTFASIAANDLDISERTIGMCLGHSWSRNVTSRYMANDQRKIDSAVRRVVDYVGGTEVAEY